MWKTCIKELADAFEGLCLPVTCKICQEPTRGISLCLACQGLLSASCGPRCRASTEGWQQAVAFDDALILAVFKELIEEEKAIEMYLSAEAALRLLQLPWKGVDIFILYPEKDVSPSLLFQSFGKFFSTKLHYSLRWKKKWLLFTKMQASFMCLQKNVDYSDEVICILSFYALNNEQIKEVIQLFSLSFCKKLYFYSLIDARLQTANSTASS